MSVFQLVGGINNQNLTLVGDLGDPYPGQSLHLDFTTGSLVDRVTGNDLVTFTRASTATYVDSVGLIQTAAINEPRFTHDPTTLEPLGLLVEGASTNTVPSSADFSAWSTTGAAFSVAGAVADPSGQTGSVQLLTEDMSNGVHRGFYSGNTGQNLNSLSIFFKRAPGSIRYIQIESDGATRRNVRLDTLTGVIVSQDDDWFNVEVVSYPNGWFRFQGAIEDQAGGSILFICSLHNGVQGSYVGDGTGGCFLWGAQMEANSTITSYIPTAGSAVTRAADVASIEGADFSSWYNSTQGTLFTSVLTTAINSISGALWLQSGTGVGRGTAINIDTRIGNTRMSTYHRNDAGQGQQNVAPLVATDRHLCTVSWQGDLPQSSYRGVLPLPANVGGIQPGIDRLRIGFNEISGGSPTYLNGTISRLTYWPTRLPDATLQGITQP